jgi:hypothetical protein
LAVSQPIVAEHCLAPAGRGDGDDRSALATGGSVRRACSWRSALIRLPTEISGERVGGDYASLANRDLQRGQAVGLPSWEAVARRLGVEPLTPPGRFGLADILAPVGERV